MTYTEKLAPPERFLVAIGLLVTALSLISINGGWFSDDQLYVWDNTFLKTLPFHELWRLFIPSNAYNHLDWQPIRDIYLKIGIALFGGSSISLKLMNISLYLGLIAFVYRASAAILSAFKMDDVDRTAAIATAIYILHPVHIESVQWVSGAKDLLMGLFCFAAIPPWLRWVSQNAERESEGLIDAAKVAALMALAVLSKGLSISFFAVLWLIAITVPVEGSRFKHVAIKLLKTILPALVCFIVYASASSIGYFTIWENYDWVQRPLIILGGQLLLGLVPYPLSWGYSPYGPLQPLYLAFGIAGLAATLWSVWCYNKKEDEFAWRNRAIVFGILFFGLAIAPHLQLIPYSTASMIYDRFDFMAVYGIAFALAVWLQKFSYRIVKTGAGLLLLALAVLVGVRSAEWRDPATMSRNDFEKTGFPLADPDWKQVVFSLRNATSAIQQATNSGEKISDYQLQKILGWLGHAQQGLSKPPPSVNKDMASYTFFVAEMRPLAHAYESLQMLTGNNALLGFDAALFSLRKKEYRKAVTWAKMAVETPGLPPENLSTAYKYLGIAHSESGNQIQGIQYLSMAIKTLPRDPAAACYLKSYAPNDPSALTLCP